MSKLDNIHDKFFKKTFSDIRNVKDFLYTALPAELQKHIDFDNLDIEPNSYIENNVKEYYSDVVIKSKIKKSCIEADLYILFEHKSYHDKGIFIQLLHYMYLMWKKDFHNKKPLRVIIPVVFYHGKKKWDIPLNFLIQFNINEEIKKYLLDFSYILFDTKDWNFEKDSNTALKNNVFLLTSLLLMKAAFNNDINEIKQIFDFWVQKGFINDIDSILFFFIYITATKDITQDKLEQLLEDSKFERSDIMPTLAQRWIEQGFEKGIEKGKLKGRLEGEKEKSIVIARNLLQKGFDKQFIIEVTGLNEQDIEKLK